MQKKKKSRHWFYTHHKIRDLNIKCKTSKVEEDNIGENLDYPGYSNDFLDTTPKAWSMKERIDKMMSLKL